MAYKETKQKLDSMLGNIKIQNRKNKLKPVENVKSRFSENKYLQNII